MRNLSFVTETCFQSFSINAGEYVTNVNINDVLEAIAKAFDSRLPKVQHDFEQIVKTGSIDCDSLLAPSEARVLGDLYQFMRLVASADKWNIQTNAFVYMNMNTGVKVVWIHTVS